MNLLLAVFNLLPVPPLDGSAAVVLFLPEDKKPRYQDAHLAGAASWVWSVVIVVLAVKHLTGKSFLGALATVVLSVVPLMAFMLLIVVPVAVAIVTFT